MKTFNNKTINSLLKPNKKTKIFNKIFIPHQLLTKYKKHNSYKPNITFLLKLTQHLNFSKKYNHNTHYQIKLIHFLKKKLKSYSKTKNFSNTIQNNHQTNYQNQIISLQYYILLISILQQLFKSLKNLKSIKLFSKYIKNTKNTYTIIKKPNNYYYLTQFYKKLKYTKKYHKTINIYNNNYTN